MLRRLVPALARLSLGAGPAVVSRCTPYWIRCILPAPRGRLFGTGKPTEHEAVRKALHDAASVGSVQPSLLIGFTCKVCNHRSHHTMSKHAYTKGTVLIQCPGCRTRHLMADHLGWFDRDHRLGKRTIEEILESRGETVRRALDAAEDVPLEFLPEGPS